VLEDAGIGARVSRTLALKRPSGRPQGKVDVNVVIRELGGYRARDAYYTPPLNVREYSPAPQGYGYPYHQGNDNYYNSAPQTTSYVQTQTSSFGGGSSYNYGTEYASQEGKKNKFGGMGTGLAVGALAGVLGGVALVEGADFLEDKIADDVAEKVEDDLGYEEDDF